MKKYLPLYSGIALLFLHFHLFAQQRFSAGLIFGLTTSQIDGDNWVGFDKLGIQTGISGKAVITDQLHVSTELLLTQKGAVFESDRSQRIKNYTIHLDYVEVPFLVNLLVKNVNKSFYRHQFNVGGSFSRLVKVRLKEPLNSKISFERFINDFEKNELNFLAGYNYLFNSKFGIGLRYNYALSLMWKPLDTAAIAEEDQIDQLRNYFLTLRLFYYL